MAKVTTPDIQDAPKKGDILQGGMDFATFDKWDKQIDADNAKAEKVRNAQSQNWKDFEAGGGHKAAMKAAQKIRNMSVDEAADYMKHFVSYLWALKVGEQTNLLIQIAAREALEVQTGKPASPMETNLAQAVLDAQAKAVAAESAAAH